LRGDVEGVEVGTAEAVELKTTSLPTMWTGKKLVAIKETFVFGHENLASFFIYSKKSIQDKLHI
ncbi:hypothetical protein ACJBV1_11240, partial [Streptococcus suis]